MNCRKKVRPQLGVRNHQSPPLACEPISASTLGVFRVRFPEAAAEALTADGTSRVSQHASSARGNWSPPSRTQLSRTIANQATNARDRCRSSPKNRPRQVTPACPKSAANNGHSFRVASAIQQRTLGLTKQHRARLWPTTSCWLRHVSGSGHPQNLVFKPRRSHDPDRFLLRSNRLGPPI
jgi:hypothetical protein